MLVTFWSWAASLAVAVAHVHVPLVPRESSLHKRSAALEVKNALNYYYATLNVGTPPQPVDVIVDTGSSDLWFPGPGAISGSDGADAPGNNIYFNYAQSSSLARNNTDFATCYMDGTIARGWWGEDSLQFDNVQLNNVSMGIATTANTTVGILGLGLPGLESTVTRIVEGRPLATYANLPVLLKEQGVIEYMGFSVSLGSSRAQGGSLIFGGVDHAGYNGQLTTVPLVRTYDAILPMTTSVMLHGISINSDGVIGCAMPVLLDSGSSLSHLPAVFVKAIAEASGATYNPKLGVYILPCASNASIELDLSGFELKMSNQEFIPLTDTSNNQIVENGQDMCMMPFTASYGSYVLGIGALRSLYLCFDYEKYEVAMAPRNNASGQIEDMTAGIPSAVQAPSYSATSSYTNYTILNNAPPLSLSGVSTQVSMTFLVPLADMTGSAASSASGHQRLSPSNQSMSNAATPPRSVSPFLFLLSLL